MAKWIDIGKPDMVDDGAHVCTQAAGRPIVVFRTGGEFHIIENICPHAGLPLGEGERHGQVITCPYHGYAYSIRSGRNIDFPDIEPPVKTYPTRVENGVVQAQFEDADDQ